MGLDSTVLTLNQGFLEVPDHPEQEKGHKR